MDMDRFRAAVRRVWAEQYFQEKTASAPAVSAVELANKLAAKRLDDVEHELAHEDLAAARRSGHPQQLRRARESVAVFGKKTP